LNDSQIVGVGVVIEDSPAICAAALGFEAACGHLRAASQVTGVAEPVSKVVRCTVPCSAFLVAAGTGAEVSIEIVVHVVRVSL
jgi:hypothetical protein